MFKIIRDTREKVSSWTFSSEYCDEVISRKLDTGDYSIEGLENVLCIERKRNVTEFANNVNSDAFHRELERMTKYQYRFIIFEFKMDDILRFPVGSTIPKSKWQYLKVSSKYMMKIISDIQVKYDIHVLFAGDVDNACYLAANIMKRVYEQKVSLPK